MLIQRNKKCKWNLCLETFGVLTLLCITQCSCQHHPTRVPGSPHLVVQTDFPYLYWRPPQGPYTPTVPSTPTTTPASYGYFYGDAIYDLGIDSSSWHILPIQIPDDLVGAVNQRTTRVTTPAPTYPTSATPQYGRYPGVTERPHLYHPERLFKDQSNHNYHESRPSNRPPMHHHDQYTSHEQIEMDDQSADTYQNPQSSHRPNRLKKPQQTPWHQSLFDQLEPFMEAHLPKFQSLPSINNLNRLPNFPPWSLGNLNKDSSEESHPSVVDTQKYDTEVSDDYSYHQFYPIPNPAPKRQRKTKRPGQYNSESQQTIILSTPYTFDTAGSEDEQFLYPAAQLEDNDHLPQSVNHASPEEQNFLENTVQYIRKQIRPMNSRRRPLPPRRRPGIRRKHINNRPQRISQNNYADHSEDEYSQIQMPAQEHHHVADDRYTVLSPSYPNITPIDDQFRPSIQNNRPFRKPQPPNTIPSQGPQHTQNQEPYPQLHKETHQSNPNSVRRPKPHQIIQDSEYGIIERLTDPLAAGATLPGGMLVVAMGLALFYFNFVWYPTPVVTARLIKLISDLAPDDLLDTEKQKAIGEVYEVFRSLEVEYMQDSDVWQPSCKSRLVCQVHQELPGLWQVTHSYETLVRSSLATGPTGTEDLETFLEAAKEGDNGTVCDEKYSSCLMTAIPIKSSLRSLLGIQEEMNPMVVYS